MWAAQASLHDADRKSENRSDGEAMSKDNVVVGFIGLGTMGGHMAANVQRAGFKLLVHDLHRQAASHHLAAGAIWADSPRALASAADVIFSSLPEPSDVEAVALGAIGDKAAYIGPIGSATVAKLVHNMSGYAIVCALAETFTMGVKAGIE